MPSQHPFLRQRLEIPFPAEEPHAGIALGNGTLDALLWGGGRAVRVTLGRADYWYHGRSAPPHPEATYANLCEWLQSGDTARLEAVFGSPSAAGDERASTRLPLGRIELQLPDDWSLVSGGLHLETGEAELELDGYRDRGKLRGVLLREAPVLCLRVTGPTGGAVRVSGHPAESPALRSRGMPPPVKFDLGELGGWVQEQPSGPAVCVAWLRHEGPGGLLLYLTAAYGADPADARKQALSALEAVSSAGYTPATLRSFTAFRRWWEQLPVVSLPDPALELLYYTGLYRLSGFGAPGDAWVEERSLPALGGGPRFDPAGLAAYWPAAAASHPECLDPLERWLAERREALQAGAAAFAGTGEGLLLPRVTDQDGGAAAGASGLDATDPAGAALAAQLCWQRYRLTGDVEYLRETAYPLLRGAMRVYEYLLRADGAALALPAGSSPGFEDGDGPALGRNPSFHLTAIHFLGRALLRASELLGRDEEQRAVWREILTRLPLAATDSMPELLVWEGQPLSRSQPLHSHLAAIYPFDLLDLEGSEADRRLVRHSLRRLTERGAGRWTAASFPWGAILHARAGNGDAAALLLETFRRAFVGPGCAVEGTARVPGVSAAGETGERIDHAAGPAAAAAVLEMLLHTAGGVLRVFPAVPAGWRSAGFQRVRAEGAFLVSAALEEGRVRGVEVTSERGETLRLRNPWSDGPVVIRRAEGPPSHVRGRLLEIRTAAGETLTVEPAGLRRRDEAP
ncbi:MAG: glycosyl hydrolase family 95 catalytic domain-containing protein [Armatimonadota bacterium]